MQSSNIRHPLDLKADSVYAAMETGNPGKAREVLKEMEEMDEEAAYKLRGEVTRDYGIVL
jgi:hypothetical protein